MQSLLIATAWQRIINTRRPAVFLKHVQDFHYVFCLVRTKNSLDNSCVKRQFQGPPVPARFPDDWRFDCDRLFGDDSLFKGVSRFALAELL